MARARVTSESVDERGVFFLVYASFFCVIYLKIRLGVSGRTGRGFFFFFLKSHGCALKWRGGRRPVGSFVRPSREDGGETNASDIEPNATLDSLRGGRTKDARPRERYSDGVGSNFKNRSFGTPPPPVKTGTADVGTPARFKVLREGGGMRMRGVEGEGHALFAVLADDEPAVFLTTLVDERRVLFLGHLERRACVWGSND